MKITKSQQNELEVWKYFIPTTVKWKQENDQDIKKFFEWSEKGLHKDKTYRDNSYFNALREGKRWAGIHMQMYEEGILDGTMPYYTILGHADKMIYRKWYQFWKPKYWFENNVPPRQVVEFMKKELFKGIDSERIESIYQELLVINKYGTIKR